MKRGFGIGLYVCKHTFNSYEGKIWMESEEGVGTDIHIKLPIKLFFQFIIATSR
ncbi:ATP-binding protein [Methanococcoides seepicolus]|uniref:ATP-binding protein n=1 Tax=Methanococcoides seepicolus TaxID=2828780 RepID=A0A9E4ZEV8_9EURY|nr:ATP-binding protein [Methanococcoides seepicolus]